MIVKDGGSLVHACPWRIAAALVVACLFAVGGWVFAQDKPPTPAAPAVLAATPGDTDRRDACFHAEDAGDVDGPRARAVNGRSRVSGS
jgi:hypothetical protein